ncbi:hypothetical protein EJ07DRAFT_153212 [Lizonia empirigonia]|nr:hypothetical protein EJ07DRAFT_153212 [Lizonia empirigonia]
MSASESDQVPSGPHHQSGGHTFFHTGSTYHEITSKNPNGPHNKNMSTICTSYSMWRFYSIPAFLTAAYALNFLLGIYKIGDAVTIDRIRSSVFGNGHILGGLVAIILGPFQFIPALRNRKPSVHVWIGRVYVGGVVLGGISAFKVSFTSICRPLGQYGFALLASAWLVTAAKGMSAIWAGRVTLHRQWMTRNFALTYAAVMLRWQLLLYVALGMEIEPALSLTGFSCWIPNLIFIEWWMRYGPGRAECIMK